MKFESKLEKNMDYAYVRVSSASQNIGRQLEDIKKFNVEEKNIFIDKESGKNFNRKNYKRLLRTVKENDLIIVKSIDRLGRNYKEIGEQWAYLTQRKKVNICVIDMPILDTRKTPSDLLGKFISDLILQLLSFIAENERNNIKSRQAEGIKLAKIKGVKFGRPSFEVTENFKHYLRLYKLKIIKIDTILKEFKISKSSFYKYAKLLDIKI